MKNIRIPVGVENFEEIRTSNAYYVDKTRFIVELVNDIFSVNLVTRPRRFGKTLMMSMLENFFDIRKDSKELFEGLEISKYPEICEQWMNQWPVLFLSFKDIAGFDFQTAYDQLAFGISGLCINHAYLQESSKIDSDDRAIFERLKACNASKSELRNSLYILTRMVSAHYGKQVILLIDEYDVPLAKANENDYYREMLDMIRAIMSVSLKTNLYLKCAVITGCLRIAKESIFTGTNHFVNNSIDEGRYMDAFGFTEDEVKQLLKDTDCENHLPEMKRWYDGYHFGDYDVYCPWDVVNHVYALQHNPKKRPGNYWKDTSHNSVIRSFIGNERIHVNEKFETLLSGGTVKVQVRDDLTYDFDNSTEDNFWSILYLTGYLTKDRLGENEGDEAAGLTCLKIPNEEVKTIFADTVVEWFKDTMRMTDQTPLMEALWNGDAEEASRMISDILFQTISYHNYREDYYHAFLAGIFTGIGYPVESDKEHGEGRPDIVIKDMTHRRVIIIEAKHSNSKKTMETDCQEAVDQILVKKYAEDFLDDYDSVVCYGVAFFKKRCLVKRIEL